MEKVEEEAIIARIQRVSNKSKIETSASYEEIKRIYEEYVPDLREGNISVRQLFISKISPILPIDSEISYVNFLNWTKSHQKKVREAVIGKSLIDREMDKRKQQIEIRQDTTELMMHFMRALKQLAEDPKALEKAGVSIPALYKIIREEEDRQKALGLRERAENRADAAFAFMVSLTKAGQLTDEDVQFLEEDTKKELMELKLSHGIYKLPGGEGMGQVPNTAEVDFAIANEGNQEGSF